MVWPAIGQPLSPWIAEHAAQVAPGAFPRPRRLRRGERTTDRAVLAQLVKHSFGVRQPSQRAAPVKVHSEFVLHEPRLPKHLPNALPLVASWTRVLASHRLCRRAFSNGRRFARDAVEGRLKICEPQVSKARLVLRRSVRCDSFRRQRGVGGALCCAQAVPQNGVEAAIASLLRRYHIDRPSFGYAVA